MAATPSFAYTHESFYGWSQDGTYYVQANAGTDMVDRPVICLTDRSKPSLSWPKDVQRPAGGSRCTRVCDEGPECSEGPRAAKWVKLPPAATKGPHGETVTANVGKKSAVVVVSLAGRDLAHESVELDENSHPRLERIYWRPDGLAAAVQLGEQSTGAGEGWPPPQYIVLLEWKAGATTSGDRAAATLANTRGMKLYRAKDYRSAAAEFRKAIA